MGNLSGSQFALREMIAQGWMVLSVLLACSIISLAVMWDRFVTFRKLGRGVPAALKQIESKIKTLATIEGRERLARNEISRFLAPLESRIAILGTIAATSPFIGLLGTIIGIMKSFRAISATMGGGHAVLANGIAEALITTAAGIAVALPAIFAYNYFNRRLERLDQELSLAAGDLVCGINEK